MNSSLEKEARIFRNRSQNSVRVVKIKRVYKSVFSNIEILNCICVC